MRFLPRLSLVLLMACLAVLAHAVEDAGLLALPSGTPAPFNPMNVTIPEGASDQFTVFSRSDLTLNNGHNQASFAALNKFYKLGMQFAQPDTTSCAGTIFDRGLGAVTTANCASL